MLYPEMEYSISDYLRQNIMRFGKVPGVLKGYQMKIAKICMTVTALALLAACGGGGDTDSSTKPIQTSTTEGFWTGTASTGNTVQLVVLENGETWGIYSRAGVLRGALYGNTTSASGTLSGSGLEIGSTGLASGSYSGTYTAKSTITVKTSDGGTFNGSYSSAYEQPASLSTLAGTYVGYVATKTASGSDSVTISNTGAIQAGSASTCLSTGTATPRASGKNVFDVSIRFAGPTCLLGNGTTATGIAYYDTASRQVMTLALNSAKSDGLLFLGKK